MKSDGTWVLITGATSGIGLATAIVLAAAGYHVIATGRSEAGLQQLAIAAERARATIRRVRLDVSDESSIATMKSEVLALTDGAGVDVLVNNAGYGEGGAIEDIPLSRLRRQFEANVFGLVGVIQAFLPLMRRRGRGRIINVSSVLGRFSIPLMGAYTASKHAVEAISDALRVELSGSGIEIVTIVPGSVRTRFDATITQTIDEWLTKESVHHAAYQNWRQQRAAAKGVSPLAIANIIHAAIRAARPKPRYVAPAWSRWMPVMKVILPTRTLDSILSSVLMGRK